MPPPKRASISGLGDEGYREAMSQRYSRGETPWDTGVPSAELIRAIDEGELPGKTVLELGCGTGTNSVELARRGYAVTAVDLIEAPIQRARTRAQSAGVKVDFRVGDLTQMGTSAAPTILSLTADCTMGSATEILPVFWPR